MEIILIIVTGLVFSLLVNLPDICSVIKYGARWIPVKAPPDDIGDEYHYYSILNIIYKSVSECKFLHFKKYTSANSKFQILGYLFNLIPYTVGNLLKDKRFGILCVRIWNSTILWYVLLFSFPFFLQQSYTSISVLISIAAASLLYFISYPSLFPQDSSLSIIKNLKNKRKIYDAASANDLCRAMYSSTTAPLLILALTIVFSLPNNMSEHEAIFAILIPIIFLFIYAPISLILYWASALQLFFKDFFLGLLCSFIYAISLSAYFVSLHRDSVGRELFAHFDGGRLFCSKAEIKNKLKPLPYHILCWTCSWFIEKNIFFGLSCLLPFFISNIFYKHQISRLWDRGAVIFVHFLECALVLNLILLIPKAGYLSLAFCVFFIVCLLFFFWKNKNFLQKYNAKSFPLSYQNKFAQIQNGTYGNKYVDLLTSYLGPLYGNQKFLMVNYSIQNKEWKKNTRNIVSNLKKNKAYKKNILQILTKNVHYSDWLPFRPFSKKSKKYKLFFSHTLQFMATNREFNQALINECFYNKNTGWTIKMKKLIKSYL